MQFISASTVSFQWRHAILWCLFTTVFIGWSFDGNAGEKARSRFYALCVGLCYPGTSDELQFTTSDARAMAKAFATASGYDELSSEIDCLVDDDPRQPKPTPREVRRHLGRMAANAGPEDRLVFYFSGHGERKPDNRGYLLCHAEGDGDDRNLYLSEIRDILDQSPAKDKLLIIDACHSGGKSSSSGLAPSILADSLAVGGKAAGRDTVAWLASCDASEKSWEDPDTKQGLFTRFFLEAVGPHSTLADTNYDGMLSVPELNKYISNAIGHYIHERKVRNEPNWRTRSQSPRMGIGGTLSLSGEELVKTAIFYCPPDSSLPSAKPPTTIGEKPASRFRALCVGLRYPDLVGSYGFSTFDARAVAGVFAVASGYGDLSSDIDCLVDDDPDKPKPTPGEVRLRLARMAADSGPEDKLVFYFSGFGNMDRNGQSILVFHANMAGGDDNLYLSEVRDILEQSAAKDKFLIIDASYSAGLVNSPVGATGRDTVAWLASCGVTENSWDDDESKHGLFTRFFLEALSSGSSKADVNFDRKLSVSELRNYISQNIGYYIQKRRNDNDRVWFNRSQSPSMGIGGRMLSNGELTKMAIFRSPPPDSSSSPAAQKRFSEDP